MLIKKHPYSLKTYKNKSNIRIFGKFEICLDKIKCEIDNFINSLINCQKLNTPYRKEYFDLISYLKLFNTNLFTFQLIKFNTYSHNTSSKF
jgi:hypothetical protein